jgi:hypothetical protein
MDVGGRPYGDACLQSDLNPNITATSERSHRMNDNMFPPDHNNMTPAKIRKRIASLKKTINRIKLVDRLREQELGLLEELKKLLEK